MINLHGISQESFDLAIEFEVTDRTAYDRRYCRPEWPGEQSGVTIGIGYDVGQATKSQFLADWTGKIPDAMVKALSRTCGVVGVRARDLAANLRATVNVPWDAAVQVYSEHDIPRYTALCRDHLPGYDDLSPHCKGALFSLVLNRGASFDNRGPRYAEMRDIKAAIKAGDLAKVPSLLRSMKRLWPNSKGLRIRRDREAQLWERGLADHHPEEHARLETVKPPVNPEVVALVQQQLRNLGYYHVGSADGGLGRQTEGAILAFRHDHGLPLTPTIDDDLLNALSKAQPPEVSEIRANATADDLRKDGSETISFTDKIKGLAGKLTGSGSVLGGGSILAWITDKATAVSGAKDAVDGLGIPPHLMTLALCAIAALIVIAGVGLGIWYIADRIEQRRVADYRTGKHP